MAEAFADWGRNDAEPDGPAETTRRRIPHLRSVRAEPVGGKELLLVVRIEFTEEDVGA